MPHPLPQVHKAVPLIMMQTKTGVCLWVSVLWLRALAPLNSQFEFQLISWESLEELSNGMKLQMQVTYLFRHQAFLLVFPAMMEPPLRSWKFPSQKGTFTCHERQVGIKWWCWCFKFHSVSQEDDKGYSRIDKPKYISQLCALPKLYTFWIHITKALAFHVGCKSWVHTLNSNGVSHLDTDHKILPLTLSCEWS